jgi:hypothetical protein
MRLSAGIPEKLDDWTFQRLKDLLPLRDIESGNFDFKTSIKDLDIHICAKTSISGGYLVLGVDEHKSGDHLLGFKLVGFDVGVEDNVKNQIRNEMASYVTVQKADLTTSFTPVAVVLIRG